LHFVVAKFSVCRSAVIAVDYVDDLQIGRILVVRGVDCLPLALNYGDRLRLNNDFGSFHWSVLKTVARPREPQYNGRSFIGLSGLFRFQNSAEHNPTWT